MSKLKTLREKQQAENEAIIVWSANQTEENWQAVLVAMREESQARIALLTIDEDDKVEVAQ